MDLIRAALFKLFRRDSHNATGRRQRRLGCVTHWTLEPTGHGRRHGECCSTDGSLCRPTVLRLLCRTTIPWHNTSGTTSLRWNCVTTQDDDFLLSLDKTIKNFHQHWILTFSSRAALSRHQRASHSQQVFNSESKNMASIVSWSDPIWHFDNKSAQELFLR